MYMPSLGWWMHWQWHSMHGHQCNAPACGRTQTRMQPLACPLRCLQVYKDKVLEEGSLQDAGVANGDAIVLLVTQQLPPPPKPQHEAVSITAAEARDGMPRTLPVSSCLTC